MKTTTQQCFKSAYDLVWWQNDNCTRCKKSVTYNQRLGRMPQYRCAVQQQIEGQQMGNDEVSQRTFDAVQTKKCQFFVPKVEEPEILDFSKGESVCRDDAPATEPPKEEPKEQPKKKETVHDATLLRLSMEQNIPIEELEAAEKRIFETIAQKGFLPPMMDEARFRKEVKNDTQKMLETFTWEENMMIAFVPLVISRIAWWYAEKVMKYCADNRISEVKKLGRTIKEIRTRYIDELKKDLDIAHINNVERQTLTFIEEYKRDFTILWFQVNGAIKREHPEMPYQEMRTDAWCGVLMVRFLKSHNRKMDDVIAAKMGQSTSMTNPNMVKLETLLDAYLPDGFNIQNTEQIDLCLRVLANRVREIDFEVID